MAAKKDGEKRNPFDELKALRPDLQGIVWIEIEAMTLDSDMQPRAALDEETVKEYSERMRKTRGEERVYDPEGRAWEPVSIVKDGDTRYLVDGYHRIEAAKRAGLTAFQARVFPGDRRWAVEQSLSANGRHGKRRTNEDKRRAVTRALSDDQWQRQSDKQVAAMCLVSARFVGKVRRELEAGGDIDIVTERLGADGRVMNVQGLATVNRSQSPEELVDVGSYVRRKKAPAEEPAPNPWLFASEVRGMDEDEVMARVGRNAFFDVKQLAWEKQPGRRIDLFVGDLPRAVTVLTDDEPPIWVQTGDVLREHFEGKIEWGYEPFDKRINVVLRAPKSANGWYELARPVRRSGSHVTQQIVVLPEPVGKDHEKCAAQMAREDWTSLGCVLVEGQGMMMVWSRAPRWIEIPKTATALDLFVQLLEARLAQMDKEGGDLNT